MFHCWTHGTENKEKFLDAAVAFHEHHEDWYSPEEDSSDEVSSEEDLSDAKAPAMPLPPRKEAVNQEIEAGLNLQVRE